ncbi:MAG: hypothetical protein OXH38_13660, partial [Chloroflexi bacterium]|nr:hypothetical protein [Chloroflexota bacterium]
MPALTLKLATATGVVAALWSLLPEPGAVYLTSAAMPAYSARLKGCPTDSPSWRVTVLPLTTTGS